MTGVELPDYSSVIGIVLGAISIAATVFAFTRTRNDADKAISKFLKDILSSNLEKTVDKHDSMMNERLRAKFKKPGIMTKRLSMWNQRPHLKEDKHLCGFINPGEWQCRCNKSKCEAFGKLCEAVGGVDATPPVQPKPDRKAAIAHTKAKS